MSPTPRRSAAPADAPSPTELAEQAVEQAFLNLEAAVEQLPFTGLDQRVRARAGLAAARRHISTSAWSD